ncbi:MAG: hypothetical protein B6227_04720 [Fusobacteriia bacterium 4572_74]|nr:MAG: hypothetical protein B6227_04720 [Fusobacteriia bacterium 4572_74]
MAKNSEVIVYEKGSVVFFGACRLSYYVGDFFDNPKGMMDFYYVSPFFRSWDVLNVSGNIAK